jgi:UAA transporter family
MFFSILQRDSTCVPATTLCGVSTFVRDFCLFRSSVCVCVCVCVLGFLSVCLVRVCMCGMRMCVCVCVWVCVCGWVLLVPVVSVSARLSPLSVWSAQTQNTILELGLVAFSSSRFSHDGHCLLLRSTLHSQPDARVRSSVVDVGHHNKVRALVCDFLTAEESVCCCRFSCGFSFLPHHPFHHEYLTHHMHAPVRSHRKFFTIFFSVFWFGHALSLIQWLGVVVVFSALCLQSLIRRFWR